MKGSHHHRNPLQCESLRDQGFTLVELLITVVVALIVIGGVCTVYALQQRDYQNQQLALEANQNMRGAMIVLEQQIRMAGYDPEATKRFGITDVRRYDPADGKENPSGQPALFYTADIDEDGDLGSPDDGATPERFIIRIHEDREGDGGYLAWDTGSGPQLLADHIQAIGFAYAIDVAGDGRLDTWAGGSHTVWAVDSNNDNLLDTHIDANDDGVIDARDDINQDNRITPADGAPLDRPVPLDRIRAVRVWIMSVSAGPLQGHFDGRTQVVGDRVVAAGNDGYRRKVLQSTIDCRNL